MSIDGRFNGNPFIGDVSINAESASTKITCIEDPNNTGHYIVQQIIKIKDRTGGETIHGHIILRRFTKDMTTADALYFIANYYNKDI